MTTQFFGARLTCPRVYGQTPAPPIVRVLNVLPSFDNQVVNEADTHDRRSGATASQPGVSSLRTKRPASRAKRLVYPPPDVRLKVTGMPPWMLNTMPAIVPSADTSPAKFQGCVFGNSKFICRSLIVKLRSGLSIFPKFVPINLPLTVPSAFFVNSS